MKGKKMGNPEHYRSKGSPPKKSGSLGAHSRGAGAAKVSGCADGCESETHGYKYMKHGSYSPAG